LHTGNGSDRLGRIVGKVKFVVIGQSAELEDSLICKDGGRLDGGVVDE